MCVCVAVGVGGWGEVCACVCVCNNGPICVKVYIQQGVQLSLDSFLVSVFGLYKKQQVLILVKSDTGYEMIL